MRSNPCAETGSLHYTRGLMGAAARFFLWVESRGDPSDWTTIIPLVGTIFLWLANDKGLLGGALAAALLTFSCFFSGAWRGAAYGLNRFLLSVLWAILLAITAAEPIFRFETSPQSDSLKHITTVLAFVVPYFYGMGHFLVGMARETVLVSDTEWEKRNERRRWVRDTIGRAFKTARQFATLVWHRLHR